MAIKTHKIKGTGLVQLRSVRTSQEGTTFREVVTFTGPYADLVKKQNANLGAKETHLEPTEANHGRLTITTEKTLEGVEPDSNHETFIEVVWQELRQSIFLHPMFKDLTDEEIIQIEEAATSRPRQPVPTEGEMQLKLYNYLAKGTTEYSTGVPVVRKTTTRVRGDLAGGNAWFRQNPPIEVDGTWQFVKTADERRRDGKSFTQVEEWTGSKKVDPDLYPAPGGGGGGA